MNTMTSSRRLPYLVILSAYCSLVASRHLDSNRDSSSCPQGTIPIGIKNNDGFLQLNCIRPRCDEINKVKAVCSEALTNGCVKGSWVGSIHREFKGADEKAEYKCKCCSHPIFSKTVSIKPQPDFLPGKEARDGATGQGDIVDIVTSVMVNPHFDHHGIEVTSVLCHGSTTTRRPTTARPRNDNKNQNNGNNGNAGGGGGGGGGSNNGNNGNNGGDGGHGGHDGGDNGGHNGGGGDQGGHGGEHGGGHDGGHQGGGNNGGHQGGHSGGHQGGHQGGHSNGHEGGSHENCGPTGCGQPKLEGGSETHYSKQNVPKPNNPPASASDPKAWGLSPRGGGTGCFSAETLVRTRDGTKRMDEIRVGDEVLSSISYDGNNAVSYQPITRFIHKDPSVLTQYTVISTESGRSLSLTPYHLLPQFDCRVLEESATSKISARQYELLFTQSAKFASRARAGQCVLVVDEIGELVPERISNVTRAVRRGVFSPITSTGIIVANGVQASCYSSVENHALQHTFFTVMHKITRACQPYVEYVTDLFTRPSSSTDDTQIPYLLRIMLVLSDLVVGSF